MKKIKNMRKLISSNEGVAGILVALLLIGLFFSAIAFVQSVYVPQWMSQKESEHMGDVANQFSQLKFSIDTLSVLNQPNSQISNPITLGSDEMPFLNTMRSYGSLNLLPNDYKISIKHKYSAVEKTYILGAIKYDADNSYYIDQSYVYENGALIMSQPSGDIVAVQPAFTVVDTTDLSFDIIRLVGVGGKTSASGYGTYPIQTKFSSSETHRINGVEQITIFNSHLNAWYNFFNDVLTDSALNFTIDASADNRLLTISFFDTEEDDVYLPSLSLNVIEIEIQITSGWVV